MKVSPVIYLLTVATCAGLVTALALSGAITSGETYGLAGVVIGHAVGATTTTVRSQLP